MIRRNQNLLNKLNMLSDVLLLFVSYLLAMVLRFDVLGGVRSFDVFEERYLLMAAGCSAAMVLIYYYLGLYGPRRSKSAAGTGLMIAAVNAVGTLAMMAYFYLTRLTEFPRLAMGLYWLITTAFILLKHKSLRVLLRYYRRRGYNLKHVLVVGSGELAHSYARSLAQHPEMGYNLRGYLGQTGIAGLGQYLGTYDDLERTLQNTFLDEVIVALEPQETPYMKRVLASADKEGVRVSIVPFYNEYIPSRPSIDIIGDTKLINMRATPLDSLFWSAVKRGFDIVASLLLILVSSPVMLAVAVGVKLSSPGPVFFRQERVGMNKRPFMMLKFRSMRESGSEATGWTTDDDPRKTRFGCLIRKFSLDELPQFWNVLKGDMSLVGPRPEIPYHVSHFKEEVPLYLVRQQVRPGITGWAQVNGLRGDTSIVERVKYDIWYIENWSFALDMRILLRTVLGGMVNTEKVGRAAAREDRDE